MKRFASALMLLVILAATLAACGQATSPGASGTSGAASPAAASPAAASPAAASPAAAESPAASPAASATTGAAASPAGSPATSATGEAAGGNLPNVSGLNLTVKIASQTPLSGPQAAFGTGIRNGAELAVEQLAPKLGMQVELVAKDDQAQNEVGSANANQIAADQDILCVVGHLNSGVALASLPTYKNASLLMISPANTNPRITEDFTGTAYRLVGRDDVQGVVAENYARDVLKAKSVYILHNKAAYGQGIAEFFRQQAEKDGIQVLGFEGFDSGTSVFDPILTPILAAQPDVVFYGGEYADGGPLLKQMRDKGIQAQFLGPDGLDSAEFAKLAGEAVTNAQYTTTAGPTSQFPAAAQMAKDYQSKYGSEAPAYSAQAYDSAGVCMTAIALAAQKANGKPTRQQVMEAMKELGTYQGVTGNIKFNPKGDPSPATYFIIKVTSSDPAKFSQSEIVSKLEVSPPSSQ